MEQKGRQEVKENNTNAAAKAEREPSPETDAWAAGLRGGQGDVVSDDPLVFGKPRQKQRARKPSKGEPRGPEIVLVQQREDIQAEVGAWEAGLRGGEEREDDIDAMVFSNPHFRKAKAEARPPRSPSKPKASKSPVDSPSRPRSPAVPTPKPKAASRSPQISARRADQEDLPSAPSPPTPPTQMRRSQSQPPDATAKQVPEASRQRLSQPSVDRPTHSPCRLPRIEPNDQTRPVRSSSKPASEAVASPTPPKASRAQSVGAARRATPKEEGGRQMFDKNELRSMHKDMFRAATGLLLRNLIQVTISSPYSGESNGKEHGK